MSSRTPLVLGYQTDESHLVIRMPSNGYRLNGDRAISEEACKKIANFVSKQHPNFYTEEQLNSLKRTPLNYEDLTLAISIIKNIHTRVIRVSNEINRDPRDNTVFVTTESELTQDSNTYAALVREGRITVGAFNQSRSLEFLFVSDHGWNALNKYKESKSTCGQLTKCCKYISCIACVSMITAAFFSNKQD